jgi:predicted secreted protein
MLEHDCIQGCCPSSGVSKDANRSRAVVKLEEAPEDRESQYVLSYNRSRSSRSSLLRWTTSQTPSAKRGKMNIRHPSLRDSDDVQSQYMEHGQSLALGEASRYSRGWVCVEGFAGEQECNQEGYKGLGVAAGQPEQELRHCEGLA